MAKLFTAFSIRDILKDTEIFDRNRNSIIPVIEETHLVYPTFSSNESHDESESEASCDFNNYIPLRALIQFTENFKFE